jgi:uncharacterized protein (TIGR02284 family)
MTTNDDTTLLVLNELLMANRDAEQGYQAAADAVHEAELVELFEGYALQRGKYVQQLENRIRTLRGTPAKSGSPLGALHRGWMNFKANTDAHETHALLAECERGEDMALKLYAAALKTADIDGQSRSLIQAQYEQVQAAHDRVRQLRDSPTYAHR